MGGCPRPVPVASVVSGRWRPILPRDDGVLPCPSDRETAGECRTLRAVGIHPDGMATRHMDPVSGLGRATCVPASGTSGTKTRAPDADRRVPPIPDARRADSTHASEERRISHRPQGPERAAADDQRIPCPGGSGMTCRGSLCGDPIKFYPGERLGFARKFNSGPAHDDLVWHECFRSSEGKQRV